MKKTVYVSIYMFCSLGLANFVYIAYVQLFGFESKSLYTAGAFDK